MPLTRTHFNRTIFVFTLFFSTTLVSACYMGLPSCESLARNETGFGNAPFEQIFTESVGSLVEGEAWLEPFPGLIVVTTEEEILDAAPYISQSGEDALRQIDYQNEFAMVAFIGVTGSIGNLFCVTQVQQRDHKVTLFAHFAVPHVVGSAGASQYEIISLPKDKFETGSYSFHLHLTSHQSIRPGGERMILSFFRVLGDVVTFSHELK